MIPVVCTIQLLDDPILKCYNTIYNWGKYLFHRRALRVLVFRRCENTRFFSGGHLFVQLSSTSSDSFGQKQTEDFRFNERRVSLAGARSNNSRLDRHARPTVKCKTENRRRATAEKSDRQCEIAGKKIYIPRIRDCSWYPTNDFFFEKTVAKICEMENSR